MSACDSKKTPSIEDLYQYAQGELDKWKHQHYSKRTTIK